MIIRAADEKDIETIFELYWASNIEHEKYSDLDKIRPKEMCKDRKIEELRKRLLDKNFIYLVAELDKKIIGMISGCISERDDQEVLIIDKGGFIEEFYVLPEYRKNGIGKKLLDEMCLDLKAKEARFIGLAVSAKNPALKVYLKNGFKIKSYWLVKNKEANYGN